MKKIAIESQGGGAVGSDRRDGNADFDVTAQETALDHGADRVFKFVGGGGCMNLNIEAR